MKMLQESQHILWIVDEYIGFDGAYGLLNRNKLTKLVDDYYRKSALIFNLDIKMWNNPSNYLGYKVYDLDNINYYVYQMQKAVESELWAKQREMAAFAIMPISIDNYPGYGKTLAGPVADPNGNAIVANIIWRNKASRRLYPMDNRKWTCGDVYKNPIDVLEQGIAEFADTVAQVELFRNRLALNHKLIK